MPPASSAALRAARLRTVFRSSREIPDQHEVLSTRMGAKQYYRTGSVHVWSQSPHQSVQSGPLVVNNTMDGVTSAGSVRAGPRSASGDQRRPAAASWDCTFFTRKEILRVHKKFRGLQPDVVPRTMTREDAVNVRVPREILEKLPELRENPFKTRICEVFSSDDKGNLSFEDFLDMLSILSEHAPRDIKVYYAFKIYDFDNDQFLGPSDLQQTLQLLTRSQLLPEEMSQVCEKVVDECDVDADGKLSYMEFEHVITRAPDFLSTFHIRI